MTDPPASAAPSSTAPPSATATAAPAPAAPVDRLVETVHTGHFGGAFVSYTATCGTVVLHEEHEKDGVHEGPRARATVFCVAYTQSAPVDPAQRPVTFCFNGGPGSSAVWLHLGLFGPQRVVLDDDGRALGPTGPLTPNAHSLLDVSDLVFIDPVGTGYSRMVAGEKTAEFHDIARDVDAVAEFIRLWCARNRRWASPKFIAGESYGTTRACILARQLQQQAGLYVSGLMLISCALEFSAFRGEAGELNDLPYALYLPGFTAAAWYHRRLPQDLLERPLREVLQLAERFAATDYLLALFQGRALDAATRERIAAVVARYTGLAPNFVLACNLRVDDTRYFKELLRDASRVIGRLDARFTGRDRDDAGETPEDDPSYTNLVGPYAAAINQYLRVVLNYETDTPYRVLTELYKDWSWGEHSNRYVSVGDALRKAMEDDPHLRVFVASGVYDLATPYFATDYALSHLALDAAGAARITIRTYEAGHMMYIHRPSLEALATDLRRFVRGAG